MLDKRHFARNPDGSIKRKQPCRTPGCQHPNEHLCFYGREDTLTPLINKQYRKLADGRRRMIREMSMDQRELIAETQRRKAAERRLRELPRDRGILSEYQGGLTIKQLKAKYKLSYYKIRQALDNAQGLLS